MGIVTGLYYGTPSIKTDFKNDKGENLFIVNIGGCINGIYFPGNTPSFIPTYQSNEEHKVLCIVIEKIILDKAPLLCNYMYNDLYQEYVDRKNEVDKAYKFINKAM